MTGHHRARETDVLLYEKSGEVPMKSGKLPSMRLYVAFLSLVGCAIMYLTRVNLTVAILAMVNTTSIDDSSIVTNISVNVNNDDIQCPISPIVDSGGKAPKPLIREFHWSPPEQGIVLGSFFYGNHYIKTHFQH